MQVPLLESRGPAKKFQHNVGAKIPGIDISRRVRTDSFYLHHLSPKVAQLSTSRDPQLVISHRESESTVSEYLGPATMWNAAQEAHFLVSLTRLLRRSEQLSGVKWLGVWKKGHKCYKLCHRLHQDATHNNFPVTDPKEMEIYKIA